MAKCLLIDGNNIVFRAYYAFQNQRLKTSTGFHTGALFGFVRMITKLLQEKKPDLVAVAFDVTSNTFRKKMYPEYKAHRRPVPEDLLLQLPLAHKAIKALNIVVMTNENYEADDLIGSTAKQLGETYEVEVVTGDRDLLQLIDKNITVDLCQKGVSNLRRVDAKLFYEEYGFEPKGIIELKALMGDSSDNIPGVKGIGEKRGSQLIQEFKTIDNLYSDIDKVANVKLKEKLVADKEKAFLSHQLATIVLDVPTFTKPQELKWDEKNLYTEDFVSFLKNYEFTSLYKEFAGDSAGNLTLASQEESLAELPGEKLAISSFEALQEYWNGLGEELCLDVETTGLNPLVNKIVGVSLAGNDAKAVYVPLRHAYLGLTEKDQLDAQEFFEFLNKNINDKKLIGHNIKFDLSFLLKEGVNYQGEVFDTLIAAYLLEPTRQNGLKNLGQNLLGFQVTEFKEISKPEEFAGVEVEVATTYACQDVLLTYRLYKLMKKELESRNLIGLFQNIEMPVLKILLEMEMEGIGLNIDYLRQLSEELAAKLGELEKSIHSHGGREFNINSPKQLQEILFVELGLTPPKKTKTGFSTDSEVLQILQFDHPICKEILEYRELSKMKNTYADALVALVDPKTNRIHASFNQAVTATGRLSSSNPNLQTIPVKTELGRQIRRAFVPPEKGHVFLSVDYSQIELRLLAHFTQDPALIEAYSKNVDIHSLTAAKIFAKSESEVSSFERSVGKSVNFGILYGISAHGLSQDIGVPRNIAKEYIDSFYESFADVNNFYEKVLEDARETKEVRTMLGRVRQIPDIASSKVLVRNGAERMAKNTVLQGSAADLVKKAMIETSNWLKENSFQSKLILQIHDELIFTIPEEELEKVVGPIVKIMEDCVKLEVPLICDAAHGHNLADLENI
jgi:DNA polymerase-1